MSNVILIMGKSGTGKSTSIKSLDPKETVVFNVLRKRLPFRGSQALYNPGNKNLFGIDDYATIISYLESVSSSAPAVRNVIIDDITYVMRKEYFKTAKVSGYNKFVDMAAHFQSIISTAESCRDDLNVFLMMHCEEVISDGCIVSYKPSTVGKLIDTSYNPTEVVPILLFADVIYDEEKNAQYGFYTHRTLVNNVEIPAKSPDGMFAQDFIPNDLALVVKTMEGYYGEES